LIKRLVSKHIERSNSLAQRNAILLSLRVVNFSPCSCKQKKTLEIYEASDIFKMFDDIENAQNGYEPFFTVDISENNDRFGNVNRIEFGKAEKYVCISSDRYYAVYSL
jgi:hypothetical protein